MIRASSVMLWFGLAILASLLLYRTTGSVHALETQLRDLNQQTENEEKSLHVLKAEWVFLTNPARIEAITRKHLALRPTDPAQISRITELAAVLPTRGEAVVTVAANTQPAPKATVTATQIHDRKPVLTFASAETHHINERMIIQHNVMAQNGIGLQQ
jgi:thioesterase domain-containing protein